MKWNLSQGVWSLLKSPFGCAPCGSNWVMISCGLMWASWERLCCRSMSNTACDQPWATNLELQSDPQCGCFCWVWVHEGEAMLHTKAVVLITEFFPDLDDYKENYYDCSCLLVHVCMCFSWVYSYKYDCYIIGYMFVQLQKIKIFFKVVSSFYILVSCLVSTYQFLKIQAPDWCVRLSL